MIVGDFEGIAVDGMGVGKAVGVWVGPTVASIETLRIRQLEESAMYTLPTLRIK